MENNSTLFDTIIKEVCALGACKATVIDAKQIETDRSFRDMCASNACGVYGKCWMCPPDVGEIEEMMQKIRQYDFALVYQQISELEDSYDFEGMTEARKKHYRLSQSLRPIFAKQNMKNVLHLGAGGCGVCEKCGKRDGIPCRFPELATPSLEAYGINVSRLAAVSGMKYINGENTVTYFGAILFCL